MSLTYIPVLPDSAPFTDEQRAWLNGYLAGLYAWQPAAGAPAAPAELKPLTILFASQTGGAEKAAKKLAKLAAQRGFKAAILDMGDSKPADLAKTENMLVIASTYGEGEPPDRARDFWTALSNGAPRLEQTKFSVLALGDSAYTKFCEFGKQLDERFAELGASRIAPRRDCDVEWVEPFETWIEEVFSALGDTSAPAAPMEEAAVIDRDNPVLAPLSTNRLLNAPGSAKDVRHFEFSLAGTGLTYACGDALGVWPKNDPALVDAILTAAALDGAAAVVSRKKPTTLREALVRDCEITRIPQTLLAKSGQDSDWATGRDVLDLLLAAPGLTPDAQEFVSALRSLAPRLYSISSSPAAHGQSVHLTISAVRYEAHGRPRAGICSTYLADRLPAGDSARIFVHENTNFRPPADEVPLIMIGPGTGIAPFRGFLHDRRARGATGRNWLFFGDQHEATDYLYRGEIEDLLTTGVLTKLDLAWSRDTAAKVYVQNLMLAQAAEFWSWLEAGAAICVCGDAQRMAKDVDAALHRIIESEGAMTCGEATAYVSRLKAERRYQRDVY
jgi:sulfite reductase (NADPH) flavoprotein alpha-component